MATEFDKRGKQAEVSEQPGDLTGASFGASVGQVSEVLVEGLSEGGRLKMIGPNGLLEVRLHDEINSAPAVEPVEYRNALEPEDGKIMMNRAPKINCIQTTAGSELVLAA